MKRRSFFAAVSGLIVLPSFLKAKEGKHVFNTKILKERIEYLNSLPPKDPLVADGMLLVMDGHLLLYSMSCVARVGDIIATDKTDPLFVADVSYGWSPIRSSPIKSVDSYKYRLKTTHSPKLICGRPVIKIGGKYLLYKSSITAHHVNFKPIMSAFRES